MLSTAEVTLIVAGTVLLGTAVTVVQKRRTDRRDAWWGRTQWALERILALQNPDDTSRTIGLIMLTRLQSSTLASNEERKMLGDVASGILASFPIAQLQDMQLSSTTPGSGNQEREVGSDGDGPDTVELVVIRHA